MGNRPTDDLQTREQGQTDAKSMAANDIAVWLTDAAIAAQVPALLDRISALEEALDRLGSMEAFKGPRTVNADRDAELLARIDFARATLDGAGEKAHKGTVI